MSSTKRTAANRRNATRSTGPRTQAGKSRSRKNAVRHGLSSKVTTDAALMAAVDELAKRIAREHGKPDQSEEARMAAEAEVRILRVRAARASLLELMADDSTTNAKQLQSVESVTTFLASGRVPIAAAPTQRRPHSVDPGNFGLAYLRALPELLRLDRYERNAFSRRRRALGSLLSH
jgi:hypothetical protein